LRRKQKAARKQVRVKVTATVTDLRSMIYDLLLKNTNKKELLILKFFLLLITENYSLIRNQVTRIALRIIINNIMSTLTIVY